MILKKKIIEFYGPPFLCVWGLASLSKKKENKTKKKDKESKQIKLDTPSRCLQSNAYQVHLLRATRRSFMQNPKYH